MPAYALSPGRASGRCGVVALENLKSVRASENDVPHMVKKAWTSPVLEEISDNLTLVQNDPAAGFDTALAGVSAS